LREGGDSDELEIQGGGEWLMAIGSTRRKGMRTNTAAERSTRPPKSVHRFTIRDYERLVEIGFFGPADRAELVDGWLVDKMPHNPSHATAVDVANEAILRLLPDSWTTRSQLPIRLPGDNAPEPDVVVVLAPKQRYSERYPSEKDIALVVEVSDTSLDDDQRLKLPQYARARLPDYWIINLIGRRVEVYTHPRGGKNPGYHQQTNYVPGQSIPIVVGGVDVGSLEVNEVLP
jgi:Uma2 family endonuclease